MSVPAAPTSNGRSAALAINHHRQGSGPPLVLIHGVGHHWGGWRPVIDLLAEEFDVIASDSPGFGSSPPLPAPTELSIDVYADVFERFFSELGLDHPHVAGNSMGGAVALELARRGAVRSASTFSPAGFYNHREAIFCRLSLQPLSSTPEAAKPLVFAAVRTRLGRLALLGQLYGRPLQVPVPEAEAALRDAFGAPAFAEMLDALEDYHFRPAVQPFGVPVTVAWGLHDRLLFCSRQAPRAERLLPWAEHVRIDAGHLPGYDNPAAVADVIRSCAHRAVALGAGLS
jgi:pimeloyl-ACP methyl ester carboxylesterase